MRKSAVGGVLHMGQVHGSVPEFTCSRHLRAHSVHTHTWQQGMKAWLASPS